jgi:maltose-binding protein MalE
MKRLLALTLCAFGIAYAVTACGGSGDDVSATSSEDKLTIVGSGS